MDILDKRPKSLRTGISYENLRILKSGKAMRIYFETLDKLCESLGCEPRKRGLACTRLRRRTVSDGKKT